MSHASSATQPSAAPSSNVRNFRHRPSVLVGSFQSPACCLLASSHPTRTLTCADFVTDNRGTIAREATDAKPDEGIPPDDAWTPWPGTSYTAYPLANKSTWGAPTYGTYGTSLYMIPEIGYTRQQYALTVKQAGEFGVPWVTPWLWLGGGCRRRVNAHSPATSACDPLWDYDIVCVRHCVCAFLHLHGPTYVQYDLPTTSMIHS
jgi:hypothetical protein